MSSAFLRGRNHLELGSYDLVSEGPAAISISKGGAQKTYSHVDPNEDAAGFHLGAIGYLLAVADGHDGSSGAESAVEFLLDHFGSDWTAAGGAAVSSDEWDEVARNALSELNSAVLREAAERRAPAAPTTLSLALVRPQEGKLFHASIGDSHVFLSPAVGRDSGLTRDLGWQTLGRDRAYFLGYQSQGPEGFREKTVIGSEELRGACAVVLATDGVSERRIGFADPARIVGDLVATVARSEEPALRPADLSRSLTEAAMAEQRRNRAGDNIASAVLWLGALG